MSDLIRPKDETELAAEIAEASAAQTPLEVVGAGSKRNVGRPLQIASSITTERLKGITLYEPNELVLSARAGTPLKEIEAALAKNNQGLAFEPIDLGPMLGEGENRATIGAVFAANLSGARRIHVGAARDHLLGIRAVNGRGEIIRSGGRVMKNVTGYDLCRWTGRLLGDVVGSERGDDEGPPQGRERADSVAHRPNRRGGDRCAVHGAWDALRSFGHGSPARGFRA